MKPTDDPTMFDDCVRFAGIELKVDPINRRRTENNDNVMAIFWEEQPFTWQFVKPYIAMALQESRGSVGFLDVGTGSGVFSILVATHFPGTSIVALDKSARAVRRAKQNAKLNGVTFPVLHEEYNSKSAHLQDCRVIGIYPPYHLYPQWVEGCIPQHARGGPDGQQEFYRQLQIAAMHHAWNGIIFFNQMCLGDEEGPHFLRRKLARAITWTNVFPPIRTDEFLTAVYNGHPEYNDYIVAMAEESPWLYYTVGILHMSELEGVRQVRHQIDLRGRSWEDRIRLHREIAAHAW